MGYRPVGVYPNTIWPIISRLSSILKDRNIHKPGGVSYGVDTSRPEYEITPKPQDTRHAEYPLGGIPEGLPKA